jgi:S1-C subfamily serine protease
LPLDTRGALIVSVVPGGPAERAGMRPGEVIVAIDGAQIRSSADLTEVITQRDTGDDVNVLLVDADGERAVSVQLGTRPF